MMRAKRASVIRVILVVGGLIAGARPASATNVTVHCGSGDHIQTAINGLDRVGPHVVTVDGTCNESVTIDSHDRIQITGNPTATIVTPDPSVGHEPLTVMNSHDISLDSLSFTAGYHGIYVGAASSVFAQNIRTYSNGRGIEVQDNSMFRGINVESDHNDVSGFRVNASSLWLSSANLHDNTASNGITATASQVELRGSNTISHNGATGVFLDGSRATFAGTLTTIELNGQYGMVVSNGSTAFLTATNLKTNPLGGLNVLGTSHATIGQGAVTNNGTPNAPGLGNGIHVGENSDVLLAGALSVKNNSGGGVLAEYGGVISSSGGNDISLNTLDGVFVRFMGIGKFAAPDTDHRQREVEPPVRRLNDRRWRLQRADASPLPAHGSVGTSCQLCSREPEKRTGLPRRRGNGVAAVRQLTGTRRHGAGRNRSLGRPGIMI